MKAIPTKGLTKDLINNFCIFNAAKDFSSGAFQNHLVFIPTKKCINYFDDTTPIDSWKSNGMVEKHIENITKSECSFVPNFVDHHVLSEIKFNGHLSKKS